MIFGITFPGGDKLPIAPLRAEVRQSPYLVKLDVSLGLQNLLVRLRLSDKIGYLVCFMEVSSWTVEFYKNSMICIRQFPLGVNGQFITVIFMGGYQGKFL